MWEFYPREAWANPAIGVINIILVPAASILALLLLAIALDCVFGRGASIGSGSGSGSDSDSEDDHHVSEFWD